MQNKNVVVKKVCHPRFCRPQDSGISTLFSSSPLEGEGGTQCRVRGKSFSFTARSGFTLIELLVVVLIIGILTAVAVPQYKKAVLHSHMTQFLTVFNAYRKALDLWLLANDLPTQNVTFTGDDSCDNFAGRQLEIDFSTNTDLCSDITDKLIIQAKVFSSGNASVSVTSIVEGCGLQFQRQKGNTQWNLAGIMSFNKTENKLIVASSDQCVDLQKIICRYWAEQGTGLGRPSSISQCATFGITLTLAE